MTIRVGLVADRVRMVAIRFRTAAIRAGSETGTGGFVARPAGMACVRVRAARPRQSRHPPA